jgi:hypothetical protein
MGRRVTQHLVDQHRPSDASHTLPALGHHGCTVRISDHDPHVRIAQGIGGITPTGAEQPRRDHTRIGPQQLNCPVEECLMLALPCL